MGEESEIGDWLLMQRECCLKMRTMRAVAYWPTGKVTASIVKKRAVVVEDVERGMHVEPVVLVVDIVELAVADGRDWASMRYYWLD